MAASEKKVTKKTWRYIDAQDTKTGAIRKVKIDDEDFTRLSRHTWSYSEGMSPYYAGKDKPVILSRVIMGVVNKPNRVFVLNNHLDMRKDCLRVAPIGKGKPYASPSAGATGHVNGEVAIRVEKRPVFVVEVTTRTGKTKELMATLDRNEALVELGCYIEEQL